MSNTQSQANPLASIRHIVAVASGKGGVGKSTTTVNLALALRDLGWKVGVLDADIYGPSVPMMLGTDEARPEVVDNKAMRPIEAQGVVALSMGNLVNEKTPMVWRGPMASGALLQLLNQTLWPELDCLLIDMPPGTGDIQLTLSQKVPLTGAVVVTTPQDIALLDAKKGVEMFRKVNVPVLGLVENMATHVCSQCGHEEHIFGDQGGKRIAEQYQTELLGALPLDVTIREGGDTGKPVRAQQPDSVAGQMYQSIAERLMAAIGSASTQQSQPTIIVSDD
ncbi:MAG: iron-sulfur cluster carrier protein ApbC [Pseudomonadota bacterium]|nr:iron-sulfur cluster carrier protein ApbC [Pseudomonadota bacterium]